MTSDVGPVRVAGLWRYPVKGLSPERQPSLALEPGRHVPGDRLFAIENGPSGFDPDTPAHQSKRKFLMLAVNAPLARLSTRFDDATGRLRVEDGGRLLVEADLGNEDGRDKAAQAIGRWLEQQTPDSLRGPVRMLVSPAGFRFTDTLEGHLSLINLASVAALEERLGAPVDPLRFRANAYLEGLAPWQEFALVGQRLTTSRGLVLEITGRIDRCAATGVDPTSGIRDLPVVRTLQEGYGHIDCGVFARVVTVGRLSEGDRLQLVEPEQGAAGLGLR
jgi:uncharacterized protein YcbX